MSKEYQDLEKAKNSRARASLFWKLFLFITILFMLEISFPPIPPTMAFPLALLSLILAGHTFFQASRLPIKEALLLAKVNKGYLSISLLCTELDLEISTAEAVLHTMEKKGLLRIDDSAVLEGGDVQYHLQGFLAPHK